MILDTYTVVFGSLIVAALMFAFWALATWKVYKFSGQPLSVVVMSLAGALGGLLLFVLTKGGPNWENVSSPLVGGALFCFWGVIGVLFSAYYGFQFRKQLFQLFKKLPEPEHGRIPPRFSRYAH